MCWCLDVVIDTLFSPSKFAMQRKLCTVPRVRASSIYLHSGRVDETEWVVVIFFVIKNLQIANHRQNSESVQQ